MSALILLSGVYYQVAFADESLPQLGENAVFNIEQEREIGEGIYAELMRRGLVEINPLLDNYINDLGAQLLSGLDNRVREYRFFIVKDDGVNAFAAPGGYIGIHAGLINRAQTRHQLASVMAHEIAHVRLMHGVQLAQKAGKVGSARFIYLLVGLLLAPSDPDLGTALLYGSAAGSEQSMVNFTRENEYEADRIGISLLQDAGFDARGMVEFFKILGRSSNPSEVQNIEYLRTHPISENRVAEAQMRIDGKESKKLTEGDFAMFKDYLAVEMSARSDQAESGFRLALKNIKNRDYMKAGSVLAALYNADPENLWYSYAYAQNLEHLGRLAEAEGVYRRFLEIFPDNDVFALKLIRLLKTNANYTQALEIARRLENEHPQKISIYEELIDIYRKLDRPVLSMLAEAVYHDLRGNFKRARQLYKSILKFADLDSTTESRVRDKLAKTEQNILGAKRQ